MLVYWHYTRLRLLSKMKTVLLLGKITREMYPSLRLRNMYHYASCWQVFIVAV